MDSLMVRQGYIMSDWRCLHVDDTIAATCDLKNLAEGNQAFLLSKLSVCAYGYGRAFVTFPYLFLFRPFRTEV